MVSLEFETAELRPVKAWCTKDEVHVTLADGRTISTPLWWYPFLKGLDMRQLNSIELMFEGVWWTEADEGVSVKSMFLGRKATGAIAPGKAA